MISIMEMLQNQSDRIKRLYNLTCELNSPVAMELWGDSASGEGLPRSILPTAKAVALGHGNASTKWGNIQITSTYLCPWEGNNRIKSIGQTSKVLKSRENATWKSDWAFQSSALGRFGIHGKLSSLFPKYTKVMGKPKAYLLSVWMLAIWSVAKLQALVNA